MPKLTRRRLLCATAPLAAAPLGLAVMRSGEAQATTPRPREPRAADARDPHGARGDGPRGDDRRGRAGGRRAERPRRAPLPAAARCRTRPVACGAYTLVATDEEVEIAPGVFFPAWTYNGTIPGPVIRATEDDLLRVQFVNAGSHPHTIHFHGIHPTNMDGVFEIVMPGDEFTYEFPARPAGLHLYHCHSTPLKKHIHKGLYGAFIIDPKTPRAPAQELVMVMNGYDTDADGENNFYTVNGRTFYYARYPIRVKRDRARPALPREPDRVRPDQLVPPARRLLPLPADRHRRQLGVHRHGDAVPGPARRPRDRASRTRGRSCSTRTSRSSPSSAGWATSRSRTEWRPGARHRAGSAGGSGRSSRSLLLAVAVALVVSLGDRVVDLVGGSPPPADEFDVRRVEFREGEIRVQVRNPQRDDLTIAVVTVDDAIVPYTLDGPATLGRLRSSTIVVPYDVGRGRPDRDRGHELDRDRDDAPRSPAARADARARRPRLPRLRADRRARRRRPRRARPPLAAVAATRATGVAGRVHGAHRRSPDVPRRRGAVRGARPPGDAAGGVRRPRARPARARGERARDDVPLRAPLARAGRASPGSRSRCSSRSGSASTTSARGSRSGRRSRPASSSSAAFLVIGFMVHNVTEGLGIAAPASRERVTFLWLAALALVAGAPAILGTWIGGYASSDLLDAALLRLRGRRGAAGRRRGRPLRGAHRARRPPLRLGRSAATSRGSPRCGPPGS